MEKTDKYTTKLGAGLALMDETLTLLGLWNEGMSAAELYRVAMNAGAFNMISAKRLKNIVNDCFAPRYLVSDGEPARLLKAVSSGLSREAVVQMMFVYTCRANVILGDFVREVYWPAYGAGRSTITNYNARDFVSKAMVEGRTNAIWSEKTSQNTAGYLTGCCGEFGLLEGGQRFERAINHYVLRPDVALILAHEMHFAGVGDNALVAHRDWALFGLERFDVVDELKRQAVKGGLIVQSAGDAVSICWKHKDMKGLLDELA